MMLPGIGQHLQAALGALRGGLDEVAGHAVLDLQRNAADVAADGGPAHPQGLGDGEAEALAVGLLQDHVGLALEGVGLYRADVVDVGEDEDVRVAADMLDDLLEVVPALWVVARHGDDESQLHTGILGFDRSVHVYHAQRILPGVEARHLQQQGTLDVDAELAHDVGRFLAGEAHVLGRQRVDGGALSRTETVRPCGT